jgi:hypothetical protein
MGQSNRNLYTSNLKGGSVSWLVYWLSWRQVNIDLAYYASPLLRLIYIDKVESGNYDSHCSSNCTYLGSLAVVVTYIVNTNLLVCHPRSQGKYSNSHFQLHCHQRQCCKLLCTLVPWAVQHNPNYFWSLQRAKVNTATVTVVISTTTVL